MPEMPDFDEIMKMAQNAQAELQKAQDNLDKIEVEGAAGGGMVKIRATAKGRILGVDIDESLLAPSEKTMLEDLVAAAINDARAKADVGGGGRNAEDAEHPAAAAGIQASLLSICQPTFLRHDAPSLGEALMGSLGAMQDFPLRIMRLMDHAEREHGTREIVAARADGTTIRTNWKNLAHDARRMGQALERLGIQPIDRVATLGMNHDRHLASWFGVVGMGGVLHTMNPRLFDDQLAYIATHAEDRVLLYDAAFETLVERMKPRWPTIEHYIRFDDEFDGWLAAEDGDYSWHEGDERDPCGLCYTSGTTGNPKGVLYEHRSTVLHAMSIIVPDLFDFSARSVMLPVVPMFHANSWCIPYAAAITGLKLVICGDNHPEHLCQLMNDEGVTHTAGVPTVWLGLIRACRADWRFSWQA